MTRFKDFLAEIDHDDTLYGKEASAHVSKQELDDSWKPLPVKGKFWKPGFTIHWKAGVKNLSYKVAVAQGNKIVIYIELDNFAAKVPGGKLTGLDVDSLSSRPEVRGTGLVLRTYEALVESGQVLFSSNLQTTGSRKMWEQLVKSPHVVPFVLAQRSAARWYLQRYGDQEKEVDYFSAPDNILLKGSMSRLLEEAYADSETRWVALPKDLPGLEKLQEKALDIG